MALSFDPVATSLGTRAVQNSQWRFNTSSNGNFYVLTTTQAIGANGVLSFGLSGLLSPGTTKGIITLSATIEDSSGGEVRVTNNSDADQLEYFHK